MAYKQCKHCFKPYDDDEADTDRPGFCSMDCDRKGAKPAKQGSVGIPRDWSEGLYET